VVASHDPEVTRVVRVLAGVDILYPGAELADGHLVLGLAGHRAGVTSDAGALVDRESISHVHRPIVMIDDRMQNFPARELSRI
jgi:hypothetical protein